MTAYYIAFPNFIDWSGGWGPWWEMLQAESPGGYRQTETRSPGARGRYEFGLTNRTEVETIQLLSFVNAVAKGRANSFLLFDTNPGEALGINEPIGVGDGVRTTFQLSKRYTLGSLTYDRVITKPAEVSMVYADGFSVDFGVNLLTGVVTTTAPVDLDAVVSADFTFYVPVRLDSDQIRLRIVEPGVYAWESVPLVALREHASV